MLNTLKAKKETSNASARVVDGKLILSFPEAISPVLWQMDLVGSKASALEVIGDPEKSLHTLTLKTPKGESLDIASFANREDAMDAFMATSDALENAHGQIREPNENGEGNTAHASAPSNKKKSGKKWFVIIASVILVIVLFNTWVGQAPRTPSSLNASPSVQRGAPAPAPSSGVPMSADDFLRAQ